MPLRVSCNLVFHIDNAVPRVSVPFECGSSSSTHPLSLKKTNTRTQESCPEIPSVFEKKKHGRLAYPNDEAGIFNKARRKASTQPVAGGYISLSLGVHDDGPKIGLSQGGVPAVETNKRIGRGSAPRGASCSSIDPADDYPVAPDSDRRDDRARPVRVNGKCLRARPH